MSELGQNLFDARGIFPILAQSWSTMTYLQGHSINQAKHMGPPFWHNKSYDNETVKECKFAPRLCWGTLKKSAMLETVWPWPLKIERNKANLRDLIVATGLVTTNEIQIDLSARVTLTFDTLTRETAGNLPHAPKKLYVYFHSHPWIQIVIQSCHPELLNFAPCTTYKFDGWPRKTRGFLNYGFWNFVYYFVAICDFELELHSVNVQFGSKSLIFRPVWPWNMTDKPEKQ